MPTMQTAGRGLANATPGYLLTEVLGQLHPEPGNHTRETTRKEDEMSTHSKQERIQQLSKHPDWRAALIILTSKYLVDDGRVWSRVDLNRERIDFEAMLQDGTFSGGEHRMLRIARSLFTSGDEAKVNLWSDLGGLDENNTTIVLRAIAAYCGR